MDTKTAVTALLLILVVITPFYIHHLRLRRKEKKQAGPLLAAAKQAGANISRQQAFPQAIIAVDDKAGLLFFLHHKSVQPELQQLPLTALKRCAVYTGAVVNDEPDRVELRLSVAGKEERLLFFERGTTHAFLTDEILGARKWADFLTNRFVQ